jgi:hypothetical protein
MSKGYWLTPEEMLKKKQQKKILTYGFIAIGTIILSTLVTIAANNF